ncbi:MAG: penicillin-binding protein activator [Rhodospirillales bacterium]|nr:penicillin-binding protein activator [Rhodospirillales bacterium]
MPGGYAPAPAALGGPAAPALTAGPRVAILLPLSGPHGDIGQAMLKAAQLGFDVPGAPPLLVEDTGGDAGRAAQAAQAAIAGGAGIILGPLTAPETAAVAPIAHAAGVAVLAFTNDPAQQAPGVWTLGITPGEQVRRLVAAADAAGHTKLAALLPDTPFGHVMAQALTRAASQANLAPPTVRFHENSMASVNATARSLADYADRRGPIDAQIRAAKALNTPAGRKKAAELARSTIPPAPFDALLLADTGESLSEVAAMLPYYDIDRSAVQFMGPALWADPAAGASQMRGAWYASTDPAARTAFVQAYSARYGAAPPAIADLAYDAAAIARVVRSQGGPVFARLTQPAGFSGSDGWLALQPDGQVRRGLAVYAIHPDGPVVVSPAPSSAGAGV